MISCNAKRRVFLMSLYTNVMPSSRKMGPRGRSLYLNPKTIKAFLTNLLILRNSTKVHRKYMSLKKSVLILEFLSAKYPRFEKTLNQPQFHTPSYLWFLALRKRTHPNQRKITPHGFSRFWDWARIQTYAAAKCGALRHLSRVTWDFPILMLFVTQ